MGDFGKFDPDESIREGWARDDEDEVSFDGYNAFIQITTSDGESGFSVTNAVGGTAFRAKSDGDGYVSKNLGVGILNPTAKLDVDGLARVQGFQLPTGAVNGYILTSDGTGVGTWQDAYVAGGGISENEHRDLDQLVHRLSEDSYDEFFYAGLGRISKIITWTDVTKTTKIRERLMTYNGVKINQVTTIQYDAAGIEVERMVENYTYNGFRIDTVTRTVTL